MPATGGGAWTTARGGLGAANVPSRSLVAVAATAAEHATRPSGRRPCVTSPRTAASAGTARPLFRRVFKRRRRRAREITLRRLILSPVRDRSPSPRPPNAFGQRPSSISAPVPLTRSFHSSNSKRHVFLRVSGRKFFFLVFFFEFSYSLISASEVGRGRASFSEEHGKHPRTVLFNRIETIVRGLVVTPPTTRRIDGYTCRTRENKPRFPTESYFFLTHSV